MRRIAYSGCVAGIAVVGAIFLLFAARSLANEANYQEYNVGDRASGMGGAACAIAESLDACFYNPAGLAWVRNNSVSVSASLYGFDKYGESDSLYPGEDLSTDAFMTIPSSMGSVIALGSNSAVAFSVFVPNKTLISEIVAYWDEQHFFNFYVDDQTLWVGPSFGCALSPELSVGASLFGVYRTYSHFESVYLGNYEVSQSYNLKHQNVGILSLLGMQYTPGDRWHFGLTCQTPSVNIWGDGKFEGHYALATEGGSQSEADYAENMDSDNHLPAKFSAGAAWMKPKSYGVAADLTYHLPTSFARVDGVFESGKEASLIAHRAAVVDMNVGCEYYVRGTYPVRGGFFTSFSTAPDPDIEHADYPAQIDLYGLTASVGVEQERITMNIGVSYAFGNGSALGWDIDNDEELVRTVVDAKSSHLFLFLNTAYLF